MENIRWAANDALVAGEFLAPCCGEQLAQTACNPSWHACVLLVYRGPVYA